MSLTARQTSQPILPINPTLGERFSHLDWRGRVVSQPIKFAKATHSQLQQFKHAIVPGLTKHLQAIILPTAHQSIL